EQEDDDEGEDPKARHHLVAVVLGREPFAEPDQDAATDGTDKLSESAEDHDHERLDDVVGSHRVFDRVEVSDDDAGDASQPGGKGKGQRVDPAGRDPAGGSHRSILNDGPDLEAEGSPEKPGIYEE